MTRKRFIKLLMGKGYKGFDRNQANKAADQHGTLSYEMWYRYYILFKVTEPAYPFYNHLFTDGHYFQVDFRHFFPQYPHFQPGLAPAFTVGI